MVPRNNIIDVINNIMIVLEQNPDGQHIWRGRAFYQIDPARWFSIQTPSSLRIRVSSRSSASQLAVGAEGAKRRWLPHRQVLMEAHEVADRGRDIGRVDVVGLLGGHH